MNKLYAEVVKLLLPVLVGVMAWFTNDIATSINAMKNNQVKMNQKLLLLDGVHSATKPEN